MCVSACTVCMSRQNKVASSIWLHITGCLEMLNNYHFVHHRRRLKYWLATSQPSFMSSYQYEIHHDTMPMYAQQYDVEVQPASLCAPSYSHDASSDKARDACKTTASDTPCDAAARTNPRLAVTVTNPCASPTPKMWRGKGLMRDVMRRAAQRADGAPSSTTTSRRSS